MVWAYVLACPVIAQNAITDSLKREVHMAITFEQRMDALVALGFELSNINFDTAQVIADRLRLLADSAQSQAYLAHYHHLQAVIDFGKSDFESALQNYYAALRRFEQEENLEMLSSIYRKLGQLFSDKPGQLRGCKTIL